MDIKHTVTRQFTSSLLMLRRAVELCPYSVWLSGSPNRYWHIAFHTLFYTHLYLAPSEAEFVPWRNFHRESRLLSPDPNQPDEPYIVGQPYTQAELVQYADLCIKEVETKTAAVNLDAPSGFSWLPFNTLELQFYNLRHVAHHTGQLAGRLRTHADIGLPWVR